MIFENSNPIILTISLVVGYLFWRRYWRTSNNGSLGGWLVQRKITNWKCSRKSIISFDKENVTNKHFKFFGASQDGTIFSLEFNVYDQYHEASFVFKLKDGSIFSTREYQSITSNNTNATGFAIGNLWLELLTPYSKWRITFNGSLKREKPGSQDSTECHVMFTMFWNAASDPVKWPEKWNEQLLSKNLKGSFNDINEILNKLSSAESGFDQFGSLLGQITIEHDNVKNIDDFNLPGVRIVRNLKQQQLDDDAYSMVGVCGDGLVYTLHSRNIANHQNIVFSGAVRTPNAHVNCVENFDGLDINDEQFPRTLSFDTGKQQFKLCIEKALEFNAIKYGVKCCFSLDLNDQSGIGAVLTKPKHNSEARINVDRIQISNFNPNSLTTFFDQPIARNEELSGGKGAALAFLTQMQKQSDNANKFIVPNGFILTSNAFKLHIGHNKSLRDAIKNIENIACHRIDGSLDDACMKLDKLFNQTPITPEVVNAVEVSFHALEKRSQTAPLKLAVRSSAIGEDSAELSSAGQNESFLGLGYLDEVLKCIQMCWASLYTVQSVKYRVQNAKPVITEMATVIQEMVAPDCAGVMFTRHPVNNNPSVMLVTANYGLGESVVSGLVDPDIFTVRHSNANNNFSILERKVGEKSHFVHMTSEDITSSANVPIEMQKKLCMTDENLLELCEIGVFLQDTYGSPRDIEWAIHKDKIYLLQSRPMTSLNAYTSWELLHEFDTEIMSDDDLHTFGNVGEVMPQAATPLTISILPAMEKGLLQNFPSIIESNVFHQILSFSHNRMTLKVFNVFFQVVKKEVTMANKIHGLTVFGHQFVTDKIHKVALHRNGEASGLLELYALWNALKKAWSCNSLLAKLNQLIEDFIGTYDHNNSGWATSASALYADISDRLGDNYSFANSVHGATSMLSVVYQILTFSIMSEKREDLSQDLINDITTILTTCKNAESAEIPVLLEAITSAIVECGKATAEEFCSVQPGDGAQWLDTNCNVAYKLFEIFIEKNKHRGFQEFDLGYETWGMNPSLVIEMLQISVRNQRQADKAKKINIQQTDEEIINGLKSITKSSTKRILRFFLPRCQKYVQHRERTKSLLIAYFHELRKGYRILAEKMQHDGILPSTDLIFYLTHREIGQVIDNHMRSYLISKAIRRRRLYPEWLKLEFDEFNWGVIKPIERNREILTDKSKVVIGTPVHEGVVTGRACVVKSFAEISKIKAGDILITHSTDIAWSPYFPILSGVVTELGGLVSHGAVVAREYGLPAIVGAKNATVIIPDGEQICMDASAGTITCVGDIKNQRE